MSDKQSFVVVETDDQILAEGVLFMVIAGIITLSLTILICAHFCKHLYKQYISKTVTKHQFIRGDVCILFVVQIIATFIRAIADLFMRTNYVTQSYNINLCGIGWFLYAYMPYVAKTFLFLLILYRTRLVFRNTAYELDKCVFLTCFVGVCLEIAVVGIIYIGLTISHTNYKPFELTKLINMPKGNDYVVFCQIDPSYRPFTTFVTLFALIMDLFWSSCAGYILITRLKKMRDDLTRMHRAEMSKIPSSSQLQLQTVNSETEITITGTEHTASDLSSNSRYRNQSTTKTKTKSVRGVTKLEHVMYKQTILTLFALVSSVLWALICIIEKKK
eukprot:77857_1